MMIGALIGRSYILHSEFDGGIKFLGSRNGGAVNYIGSHTERHRKWSVTSVDGIFLLWFWKKKSL